MILGRSTAAATVSLGLALALTACAAEPPTARPAPTFSEPELSASPSPTTSSGPPPMRVVTIGDSLMSGFGLRPEQAWPALLGSRAHLAVTNLACAGGGFVVPGDCDVTFSGFVPAAVALQPQLIVIESSSNDFWEDDDEIRMDTADAVKALHEALPDTHIVGLSTIWNDDPDVPDDTAVTSDALRDAVEAVDGTFIDIGQPLAHHPDWMQDDDIHPTPRGQRAIEQTVMSALQDDDILP
ncbi:SGNH/GDSL hydrolase family protein [Microbacterium trichothecenolyticum]|uniref:Acyl-CoA thioesterase-1 n=1 Tax=Microbacterium trichothecenolyticum TaxID=69370 RepID=A0ABU0TQK5_MICTR|nr:SGNH/GDSL hydrolase family protein [Microbacterium trichothecenolyticum]MDQ1121943.1 acyl-CoA thioesterase-1 [Microbacterium trichothecenolyticum]